MIWGQMLLLWIRYLKNLSDNLGSNVKLNSIYLLRLTGQDATRTALLTQDRSVEEMGLLQSWWQSVRQAGRDLEGNVSRRLQMNLGSSGEKLSKNAQA